MTTTHVVTFHKCGSNWFRRLFRDAAAAHNANIWINDPNDVPLNQPVTTGSSRTLAMHRLAKADDVLPHTGPDEPIVLCIRDPKDVLVSQYWSWKKTHVNNTQLILDTREVLKTLPQDEGVRYLVDGNLLVFCRTIVTWLDQLVSDRVHLLRYEDLLEDFHGTLGPALDILGLPLTAAELDELKGKYSFSNITKRAPGEEDRTNHYRKGVAGDWQNYFNDDLSERFNAQYGDLCDALGYSRAAP